MTIPCVYRAGCQTSAACILAERCLVNAQMILVPHDYGPSAVAHGEAQCKWCKGTNRENAVIAPNHCATRAQHDPVYRCQKHGVHQAGECPHCAELVAARAKISRVVIPPAPASSRGGALKERLREFFATLADGCHKECEYDEAEGGLRHHCSTCQLKVTTLAYELFIDNREPLGTALQKWLNSAEMSEALTSELSVLDLFNITQHGTDKEKLLARKCIDLLDQLLKEPEQTRKK